MACEHCGAGVAAGAAFCGACGSPVQPPATGHVASTPAGMAGGSSPVGLMVVAVVVGLLLVVGGSVGVLALKGSGDGDGGMEVGTDAPIGTDAPVDTTSTTVLVDVSAAPSTEASEPAAQVPRSACEVSPPAVDELSNLARAKLGSSTNAVVSDGRCDGEWYFASVGDGSESPAFAIFRHVDGRWAAHYIGYSLAGYCLALEGQPGAGVVEFDAMNCAPMVQNVHGLDRSGD